MRRISIVGIAATERFRLLALGRPDPNRGCTIPRLTFQKPRDTKDEDPKRQRRGTRCGGDAFSAADHFAAGAIRGRSSVNCRVARTPLLALRVSVMGPNWQTVQLLGASARAHPDRSKVLPCLRFGLRCAPRMLNFRTDASG